MNPCLGHLRLQRSKVHSLNGILGMDVSTTDANYTLDTRLAKSQ